MKNKRQIAKEQTFEKILEKAKLLIIKQGFLKTTTIDIAKEAGIAHGTLFVHFSNKEVLFTRILKDELLKIATILKNYSYESTFTLQELMENYLNLLIDEENFFVIISCEFPFYQDEIKKEIIATESIIRNLIYNKIEDGIRQGEYIPSDVTMILSFLFGTLHLYFSRKEFFVNPGQSVLQEKKKSIIQTFFQLLIKNQ